MGSKKKSESERLRNNLLSVVSHELNTPLTAILGAVTVLEERYPAENEYLPMLRRNAERLKKTIENLMELSRVDAGALRVRLSEVDLENFLRGREVALAQELEKGRFSFELEMESDLPRVCADLRRLTHVFDSLVLNAVKFSKVSLLAPQEKAQIRVQLSLEPIAAIPAEVLSGGERKTGMYLRVAVSSSLPSIGESPEHFEHLFEPFSPWRDADTRANDGLGVELALAKEILHAHEGYIWAVFPKNQEAHSPWVFHFVLPVLSRMDELEFVLNNRLHAGLGSLSKLSLLLLRAEPGSEISLLERKELLKAIQSSLFRASDSAFWIEDTAELAVLLDDCDALAVERVGGRILELLHGRLPQLGLLWATATGPEDGVSAAKLLEKARSAWRPADFRL